jgi:hypothetical protein
VAAHAHRRRPFVGAFGRRPVLLVPCLHQRDLPARDALDPAWRDHYAAERTYIDRMRGASIYRWSEAWPGLIGAHRNNVAIF